MSFTSRHHNIKDTIAKKTREVVSGIFFEMTRCQVTPQKYVGNIIYYTLYIIVHILYVYSYIRREHFKDTV